MADGWRGFFRDGGMVMVFDGSFDDRSTSVLIGLSQGLVRDPRESGAVLAVERNGAASSSKRRC